MMLACDDRHLASIERGRPFADLSHWRGAVEISEIAGVRADRQRIAARNVAGGQITDAVPHQHQGALAAVSRTQGKRACQRAPSRAARLAQGQALGRGSKPQATTTKQSGASRIRT